MVNMPSPTLRFVGAYKCLYGPFFMFFRLLSLFVQIELWFLALKIILKYQPNVVEC